MKQITFCLFVILSFSVAVSPMARASQQGAADRDGYNLVLFPIKVISHWREGYSHRTEILAVEGIANMIENDDLLELKYAYLQTGDTADTVILLKGAAKSKNINVWRQISLLSNFSPDWNRVKAIGSENDTKENHHRWRYD